MANTELNTEAKILEAANSIFLQFGYHGTTLQQIATKAGVNKTAIHYYFRSKENIYSIVLLNNLSQLLDVLNHHEFHDYFPATINNDKLNSLLMSSAKNLNFNITEAPLPTRGSDDFSHFSKISEILFFDIGNGKGVDIHEPAYKFNDGIIPEAVKLYLNLIKQLG